MTARDVLRDSLASCFRSARENTRTLPMLVKRALEEDAWRSFTDPLGRDVRHETFRAYVRAEPPKGIGGTVEQLARLCADDAAAVAAIAEAAGDGEAASSLLDTGGVRVNPRDVLRELVENTDPADLPDLIGELARAQAMAQARLAAPKPSNGDQGSPRALDDYLTAADVAERLSVSDKWVYANRDQLGGVKVGGSVRFPLRGLKRYLAARRA